MTRIALPKSSRNRPAYSNDLWTIRAIICYGITEGCRTEEVTVVTRQYHETAGELALMKAVIRLGEEGWELVAETEWPGGAGESHLRRVFKRPKK